MKITRKIKTPSFSLHIISNRLKVMIPILIINDFQMSAIRGGKRPVFLLKSMCNNHGSPLDFYYEFNIIVIIRKLLKAFA